MASIDDIHIIIVAGGTGSRMSGDVPKQFMYLQDKQLLEHTLDALIAAAPKAHYVVVMHPSYMHRADEYRELYPELDMQWVEGGDSRFESSQRGLAACPAEGVVMIHDAARPFVSAELMHALYETVQSEDAVIPCIIPSASVRQITEKGSKMLDRSQLRLVQTPQVFRLEVLQPAYEQNYIPLFTDDASVVEAHGTPITMIDGDTRNIKLTTPSDLQLAAYLLSHD